MLLLLHYSDQRNYVITEYKLSEHASTCVR